MTQRSLKLTPETIQRQLAVTRPRKPMAVAAPTIQSEAPSMVPEGKPAPPPKKEEEVIPTLAEAVKSPKDRQNILFMAERMAEISGIVGPLEKEKDKLSAALKKLVGQYQIGKCQAGIYRINYFNAPRKVLDARKLLALGVEQSTIDKATTEADCFTLRVTVGKEEAEKGGELLSGKQ